MPGPAPGEEKTHDPVQTRAGQLQNTLAEKILGVRGPAVVP